MRLIIFIVCVLTFWAFKGFENTVPGEEDTVIELGSEWVWPLIMFFVGAIAVSFIDHYIGTLERQNIRLVYLIGGAILMVGAIVLLNKAKAAHALVS
ncbi:hypothetical protein [Roseimicrobium gellanilyticum]|uniref:hypothetical protein n=1 Tax=Roseimicrobium gellanilyticum TaxID=748857 RepID=UPI0011BED745|nr:hypothetical protein [Roseimicrobium gellanilyticum]